MQLIAAISFIPKSALIPKISRIVVVVVEIELWDIVRLIITEITDKEVLLSSYEIFRPG